MKRLQELGPYSLEANTERLGVGRVNRNHTINPSPSQRQNEPVIMGKSWKEVLCSQLGVLYDFENVLGRRRGWKVES